MNLSSYQLLYPAIFRAFNAIYFINHQNYAYITGSGPGLRRPQSVRHADFHRHSQKTFAEEEGFEPPIRLDVCHVSNVVLSATQPFFRLPPYSRLSPVYALVRRFHSLSYEQKEVLSHHTIYIFMAANPSPFYTALLLPYLS